MDDVTKRIEKLGKVVFAELHDHIKRLDKIERALGMITDNIEKLADLTENLTDLVKVATNTTSVPKSCRNNVMFFNGTYNGDCERDMIDCAICIAKTEKRDKEEVLTNV